MTDRARAGKEAKLERLRLAITDMADAAEAARFLLSGGSDIEHMPWHARRALETGMFTSYWRAFKKSKGDPPLPPTPTKDLTPTERKTHEWVRDERDKVWARSDRDSHRRATSTQEGPEGIALVEQWEPPTPEQLKDLAALADKLHDRYTREAEELYHELHK